MARKISAMIVLLLFVAAFMSAPALAAKASPSTKVSERASELQKLPAKKLIGGEMLDEQSGLPTKPQTSYSTSLGFAPPNAFSIGSTYYELNSNGSCGRQIVEGGGWVHTLYTDLPGPSTSGRLQVYYAWQKGTTNFIEAADVDGVAGAGFGDIDFDANGGGAAVVAYHNVAGGSSTKAGRDFALATANFSIFDMPNIAGLGLVYPPPVCGNTTSGSNEPDGTQNNGNYIWPVIAADTDGGGNGIIHVVSIESPSNANDNEQSTVYYRSTAGVVGPDGTCGMWLDSSWNIGQVVAADPNSDNVAIGWLSPTAGNTRAATLSAQNDMDVYYTTSTNLGSTWAPKTNLTNYIGADKERGHADMSMLYTSDGCLHIAWNTADFDSVEGGLQDAMKTKLRHWDDCNDCISLALDASYSDDNENGRAWAKTAAKMNLSECSSGFGNLLYMTYARTLGTTASPDRSAADFAVYDLYVQASSTGGETWGPSVNITNTPSNGCAANACDDEYWNSTARYSSDSLRIFYIEDKDAGTPLQTEGTWTDSPVYNMALACFDMASFADLTPTPSILRYPFHTTPTGTRTETITLTNSGNASSTWSATLSESWMAFTGASSGTCPAGCTNTSQFDVQFTGPASEGFYTGSIDVTFPDPARGIMATTSVPVELYNFINFYLPESADIRTAAQRLNVNQASEVADAVPGKQFSYFADGTNEDGYMFDGHLVLGDGPNNLTYSTFGGGGNINLPTASNPFGFLYAAVAEMTLDSLTNAPSYRYATGKGYNRDSTLEYSVEWFAPIHPDTADVYVGRFYLYKGPTNPTGTVTNLAVGYYCDWDVPSDTGSDNSPGVDATRGLVYQRGLYSPPNENRWGGHAAHRDDGTAVVGGFILDNPTYIYPNSGFENDSLWNWITLTDPGDYYTSDSLDDLSSTLLIYKGASVDGSANDSLKFCVILAGQLSSTTVSGLEAAVDKGVEFMCEHDLLPGASACFTPTCSCGDADASGNISIGDAVYIINFIFGGGPAPTPSLCCGDADGTGNVSIGDAVYIINFIFGGGPAPVAGCCP